MRVLSLRFLSVACFGALLLASARAVAPGALPDPRVQGSRVYDGCEVLAPARPELEALLARLEKEKGPQILVVTIPDAKPLSPKAYATALFEAWKIGAKGKDDGVLVLHVMNEKRIEIETGYGMEGVLPDALCKRLLDEIALPFFKKADWAAGHRELARALVRKVENEAIGGDALLAGVDRASLAPDSSWRTSLPGDPPRLWAWIVTGLGLLGFVFVVLVLPLLFVFRKDKSKAVYALGNFENAWYGVVVSLSVAAIPWIAFGHSDRKVVVLVFGGIVGWLILSWPGLRFFRFVGYLGARFVRTSRRRCPECGRKATLLLGEERLRSAPRFVLVDEELRSLSHDVRRCPEGHLSIEDFSDRDRLRYEKCPECKATAGVETGRERMDSESVRVALKCRACEHAWSDSKFSFETSSGSGSSSGGPSSRSSSSSSSGSSSGGRSGGGGAGSSY